MAKAKTIYVCQSCGANRPRWEGRCSDCGAWNSFVEERATDPGKSRGWALGSGAAGGASGGAKLARLDQTAAAPQKDRWPSGSAELDRVLGGGLVPGSFLLVGGDPGIGKSTLLLQMSGALAGAGHGVLYVSAEESVQQIGLRAHRLGVKSPEIQVTSEGQLGAIIDLAKEVRPAVLVVDSIQTVFLEELQSAPGSVAQVRECAARLMTLAKNEGITVFLIGHVTKEGSLAGPRVLEHMVDAVLSFEGDANHHYRLLRALKNRFGATNELGVFEMSTEGLKEVANPSEVFLENRGGELVGSVIFAAMEGTRPLLCEIQALTTHSPMAMPRRTALGVEGHRVHMICAVLDKHSELNLANQDVFVNVVGGLNLHEPAADLAVAAALISSAQNRDVDPRAVFFGEIGLTGEVRVSLFGDDRIREAVKLGFNKIYLPEGLRKRLSLKVAKDVELVFVRDVRELARVLTAGVRASSGARAGDGTKFGTTARAGARAGASRPGPETQQT